MHWHGVRVENRYDGTHETQAPIAVGETSRTAPVPGSRASTGTTRTSARTTARRWASTATSSSSPRSPTTGRRPTAKLPLTLDDILLEDGKVAPFSRDETTLRGHGPLRRRSARRRRNRPRARARSSARSCASTSPNTANTRVFKVGLPGARMKLVGGDSGRHEHEEFVDDVLLAPSERVVVDVLFDEARRADARAPHPRAHVCARRRSPSTEEPAEPVARQGVRALLRTNPDLSAERERIAPYLEAPPDKMLALVAEMDLGEPETEAGPPSTPARCIRTSSPPGPASARSAG